MTDIKWTQLPSDAVITKTLNSLKDNGITPIMVNTKEEAKAKLLSLIPEGSEVMDMTSVTLVEIGAVGEIHNSGKYNSVKNTLSKMNRETDGLAMQKIGAAPEYSVGSVHAVTEDGKVVVGSNSGSQLPGYAYGSPNVIWIVGAQKIVKDLDEGIERVYEYVLPLESERAKKAYGVPGSYVSKLLIINRENIKDRITMIIVKEPLGY